ncbi:MAG TPA: HlyD family efflux transporter periplasmic adaptor subunit [Puia sp.]|jgi:HlyD family secretion protein|nr:HlyD family efflux transporter periplasmic adaptor subunit [Puia sp.]
MQRRSKVYDLETSDEPIREILGKTPAWLIRWGNTCLLAFFCLLFLVSLILKYPETVDSRAVLTSIDAPKPVVAYMSGKVVRLYVRQNQVVNKGDKIGYMESIANHEEVLRLSHVLDSMATDLKNDDLRGFSPRLKKDYGELGELQQSYQTFLQALLSFNNYLANGFYVKRRSILYNDLDNLEKSSLRLLEQKKIQDSDLVLSQKNFSANEMLNKEKVISDAEYRAEKSRLLNKQLLIPIISSSIIENNNQQNAKRNEILELENTISQQKSLFREALNTFKSQVDDWKFKYVLSAPISGKFVFSTFLQENQQLQLNQTVGYINPYDSHYFAEMYIPQNNFGKVKVGQKVILKFSAYPFQEYGAVYGKIEYISHIGTDSGYLSKISLPDGLLTSSRRHLQYEDRLMASAQIVTRDQSLLGRVYYSIVKAVKPD